MDNKDPETYAIIGAAMRVHSELGCGFLGKVYQDALEWEFHDQKIACHREFSIPIFYREHQLKSFYIADFICYENIIVELKALKELSGMEESQVLNYLKATKFERAVLLNFGKTRLKYKRYVHHYKISSVGFLSAD